MVFYNFVILVGLYKIWYLNLGKALLFPRNQAICLKNWKLWRAPTTTKFSIFCWNFTHVSYLTMSTKGCSGIFLLRSWVINKNVKHKCVETRSFLFLQIAKDLNETRKIPNTLLKALVSRKRLGSFGKKYQTLW